ncbi:DHHA1 domain-containing protein, partial [uncultured Selenomonas sp.]|uniref:alanine--tRNA ligase-related protein n=1 Tax=uncultured Selenomonas sp. TaxID=159275 RepID=UPI0025D01A6C
WKDGKLASEIHDGEEAGIILEKTPFYAEGGGQVGDEGYLLSELGRIHATNAKKLPDGTVYHISYVEEGQLKVGDTVKIEVDQTKKLASARNHTATHLLQAALKRVVGDQVNQAGSSVTPERLRFDFTNFEPVSAQQLADVEELVNNEILKGIDVEITHMNLDEAKKAGAMALFSEKYGDVVRVVKVPGFSMELCAGSHVKNIGQIGAFKIVAETGVASGVRRIEALTGKAALDYMNAKAAKLAEAASKLKSSEDDVPAAIDKLLEEKKAADAQLAEVAEMREKADAKKLLASVEDIAGVPVACGVAHAGSMDELREVADLSADKLDGGVVVLACVNDGKVSLVVKASKDAVKKGVHAGKVIKEAAAIVGGGGGGRPDMAQAGGKNPDALPKAFGKAVEVLKAQLG